MTNLKKVFNYKCRSLRNYGEKRRNCCQDCLVVGVGWGIYEGELSTGVGTIQGGPIHAPVTRQ